ncbi:hypothetical protein [Candidatus Electronema sp. PJ]|uniref:hypothetical protein n=1 Tax=Candidatus Electronema sp. PJ TaxID=3401572 RepID=UPI003AA8CD31
MLEDLLLKVVAGVIGAGVMYLLQRVYGFLVENKAPYTGTWYSKISDGYGSIIKQDTWIIRQREDTLTGLIKRTFPVDQKHRQWKFSGKMRGHDFIGVFWAASNDIRSYGSYVLRQTGDDKFEGYYLSMQRTVSDDNGTITEVLHPVQISLHRIRH